MNLIHQLFRFKLSILVFCITSIFKTLQAGDIEVIITPYQAQQALLNEYNKLAASIHEAVWNGKIASYLDSNFRHKLNVRKIDSLSRKHERKQFINPNNPDDPYDIIEVDTFEYFNIWMLKSIHSNGSFVCLTGYADSIFQLYFKFQDIQKYLSPEETWLLNKSTDSPLTGHELLNLANESFFQIQFHLYTAKSNSKIKIYRDNALKQPVSIDEVEAKGSYFEYQSRWKDTTNFKTKQLIRSIDSLNDLSEKGLIPGIRPGAMVYVPFDSNFQILDTIYYPFKPNTGLKGIRFVLQSKEDNPYNITYKFRAIAPCYLPSAGGIELPKPQALFWLSTKNASHLLPTEDQLILNLMFQFTVESLLDGVVNDDNY